MSTHKELATPEEILKLNEELEVQEKILFIDGDELEALMKDNSKLIREYRSLMRNVDKIEKKRKKTQIDIQKIQEKLLADRIAKNGKSLSILKEVLYVHVDHNTTFANKIIENVGLTEAFYFSGYLPETDEISLNIRISRTTDIDENIINFIEHFVQISKPLKYQGKMSTYISITEESLSAGGSFDLLKIEDEWVINKTVYGSTKELFKSHSLEETLLEIKQNYYY
jgi:hypothetical protein